MEVKVPYGKDFLRMDVPEGKLVGVYGPNEVAKADYKVKLRAVLKEKGFEEFLKTEEEIVFVVNDGTRATPTAKILEEIWPLLKGREVFFLAATGVHRGPTEDEWQYILGEGIYKELSGRGAVKAHDARRDEVVCLGKTKYGTDILINKKVAEASKVVVIGSVEPHYFAGYTGGRKAFLPGVAGFASVEQNHKLAMSAGARALALEGNPVHEDMAEAYQALGGVEVFSIMAVLDREDDIYAVTAGDLEASFAEAVLKADEVFCVEVGEKAEIVISAAPYPMDVDLYQSQKAIESGKLALKEGGILIMVSQCRDGIGERGFFDLLAGAKEPGEVLEKIEGAYKLGYHKAGKILEMERWAQTWAVTDLADEIVETVHMKPYHDLEKALSDAFERQGKDAKVIVLLCGSVAIPRVAG
jgi:nickel-dependent lactate racemase